MQINQTLQGILVYQGNPRQAQYHVRDQNGALSVLLTDASNPGSPELQAFYRNAKVTITIEYDEADLIVNPHG